MSFFKSVSITEEVDSTDTYCQLTVSNLTSAVEALMAGSYSSPQKFYLHHGGGVPESMESQGGLQGEHMAFR